MAERVCPWWVGYLLVSPLRRLFHNPVTILGPHVNSGMTVVDIGCAMGFFSLPLAEMVGPGGRVVCVDLQERMMRPLNRRATKAGVSDRIETRVCRAHSLGLDDLNGKIDFALAFAVVQVLRITGYGHGGVRQFGINQQVVMAAVGRHITCRRYGNTADPELYGHRRTDRLTVEGFDKENC